VKVFNEEQKFSQTWIFLGLAISYIAVLYPIIKNLDIILSGTLSEKIGAFSGFLIISLVLLLFKQLKLKTRIDEKGIYYRFSPFHFKDTYIPWNEIYKSYVRNYDAIFEYGGWGMKFSFRKKRGKSFTVKGNIGLQLELQNGSKILIGTQKKDEIQRTIDTYQNKSATNEY